MQTELNESFIYTSILDNINAATSFNRLVVNELGEPIDAELIYANSQFSELLGIDNNFLRSISFSKLNCFFRDIEFDWIDFFGTVALNDNRSFVFDRKCYLFETEMKVRVYSPYKSFFALILSNC